MPPKKMRAAPATSPPASALKQPTSPNDRGGASAAKKAEVAYVRKGDVESSKKVRFADVKDKPEKRAGNRDREEKRDDEVALPEAKRPRRGRKQVKEDAVEDKGSLVSLPTASNRSSITIIIEACTQCKSFKERADKVKRGLESAIPGISVEINPHKPRRGYFEIREQKTEVFLSLPSMNRPFTLMKKLNMDEVVEDLIKRCK